MARPKSGSAVAKNKALTTLMHKLNDAKSGQHVNVKKTDQHASAVPKPLNANTLKTLPISDYVNEFMSNQDGIWDVKSEIADEITD